MEEAAAFRVGDSVQLKDGSKAGQVHEVLQGKVKVLFQDSMDLAAVPIDDVEFVPKRFAGVLTKYSSRGRFVRNWKTRWFEVWSDSLTYRAEDTTTVLGGVILTSKSEIIEDNIISKRKDRFKGDPPHEHYCGIYDSGKTLWVSSPSPELMSRFKREVQEAINASVARDPSEMVAAADGRRASKCVIQ